MPLLFVAPVDNTTIKPDNGLYLNCTRWLADRLGQVDWLVHMQKQTNLLRRGAQRESGG